MYECMYQGIQDINYRKATPACDGDASVPDALNYLYAWFDAQNELLVLPSGKRYGSIWASLSDCKTVSSQKPSNSWTLSDWADTHRYAHTHAFIHVTTNHLSARSHTHTHAHLHISVTFCTSLSLLHILLHCWVCTVLCRYHSVFFWCCTVFVLFYCNFAHCALCSLVIDNKPTGSWPWVNLVQLNSVAPW